jgi:membrane dipeptidase
MLEVLAANGGVLGLIWFCHENLDAVVADIETALEVMGPDHVGLGSDLYGLELAPKGLEDISKAPAITRALVRRGHSDEVIRKFLGENYLRVFDQVWATA